MVSYKKHNVVLSTDDLILQLIAVLDNDLLGFTIKATHPEHHVKVQVLLRCYTHDPCSWVEEGRNVLPSDYCFIIGNRELSL